MSNRYAIGSLGQDTNPGPSLLLGKIRSLRQSAESAHVVGEIGRRSTRARRGWLAELTRSDPQC